MITPEQVLAMLEEHTNVLLYGPPGTGKSYLMKQVDNLFKAKYGGAATGTAIFIETDKEREAIVEAPVAASHSRWVTFHQGYSYEDFIIGLRPVPSKGDGTSDSVLSLEAKAGALLELAAYAKDAHGLMLIDEINRGNASRIFGEFITLMEADKRLGGDGTQQETTVTVTLPYLANGQKIKVDDDVEIEREFQMPRNVYTLASMNSVDKSVAPIDAAIRRRFYVCQLKPTDDDWASVAGVDGAKNPVAEIAAKVMKKVNRGVGLYLGPDYMLGQYYLPAKPKLGEMDDEDAKRRLVSIWRHKVIPQLLEFFHARPSVCVSILELNKLGDNSGLLAVNPTEEEANEGASAFVVNNEAEKSDDEIYAYLANFAATSAST